MRLFSSMWGTPWRHIPSPSTKTWYVKNQLSSSILLSPLTPVCIIKSVWVSLKSGWILMNQRNQNAVSQHSWFNHSAKDNPFSFDATAFPSPSMEVKNETTPTTRRNDSSFLTTIIGVVVVVVGLIIGIIIIALVVRHRQVKYSLKNLSERCVC